MDKAYSSRNASGVPRFGGDTVDGIALGIQRSPAEATRWVAFEYGYFTCLAIDPLQSTSPLSAIEANEDVLWRDVNRTDR